MSSIINKVKDAIHKGTSSSAPEGTHRPHSSRIANTLDPRVHSDKDNSKTVGSNTNTQSGTGITGGNFSPGLGTSSEGAYDPQGSKLANAADPRIDSDRDNSKTVGGELGSGTSEGTYGPHGNRVANAVDPRADSDQDRSKTIGTGGI